MFFSGDVIVFKYHDVHLRRSSDEVFSGMQAVIFSFFPAFDTDQPSCHRLNFLGNSEKSKGNRLIAVFYINVCHVKVKII